MKVHGDYHGKGYAHIEGLIPPEVAKVFLNRLKTDMERVRLPLTSFAQSSVILNKSAIEISGHQYRPMIPFLWGLTPIMSELTGRELLPTYNYFRIYREGDVCKVHSDRAACEHSLSLALGYSDDKVWNFEIGTDRLDRIAPITDDFGDADYASIAMQPGDAVLYKGVHYRHGRVSPNPNRWSAHMFLHWVDREGAYKGEAFDKQELIPDRVEFAL